MGILSKHRRRRVCNSIVGPEATRSGVVRRSTHSFTGAGNRPRRRRDQRAASQTYQAVTIGSSPPRPTSRLGEAPADPDRAGRLHDDVPPGLTALGRARKALTQTRSTPLRSARSANTYWIPLRPRVPPPRWRSFAGGQQAASRLSRRMRGRDRPSGATARLRLRQSDGVREAPSARLQPSVCHLHRNEDVPDFVPQVRSCDDEPALERGGGGFGACSPVWCRSSDTSTRCFPCSEHVDKWKPT